MAGDLVPLSIGCVVAVLSAAGVVIARRPVHCAFFLLLHSLAIAGLYLALSADFVAMGQITVYAGAIVVLFLFVVLLLPQGGKEQPAGRRRLLAALLGGGVVLAGFLDAISELLRSPGPTAAPAADFSVAALARSLFGPQLVPFELTALLLLVAVVGGVSLWQRPGPERAR